MALVWTAALMSVVVSASIADVFVLSTLSGVTVALVFTRFGWTPLAPGIFQMMMSCTGHAVPTEFVHRPL